MKKKIDVEGWMEPVGDERTRLMPDVKVVVWTKTTCFEGCVANAPWERAVKYRIAFIPPKAKVLSEIAKQQHDAEQLQSAPAGFKTVSAIMYNAQSNGDFDIRAALTQKGGDHYLKMAIQPWDVVDTWPKEQQIGYHLGNLVKYTLRFGKKDDLVVSAEKIAHYSQKLLEVVSK
jgi:hypothetical protein